MARGRRRMSSAGHTLPQLLNEAQRETASAHLRYAKMMWDKVADDAPGTLDQLLTAMKHFATVAEHTTHQTRLLNLFGTFANEADKADRVAFMEALLCPLVELSYAKDHTARWRVCQLLHALMGNLPAEAELSDELFEGFQAAMLDRLEDTKPTIRAVALRALARLPDPGDAGDFSACELTRTMVEMLGAEKSTVVRKAVLATLPCSEYTLKYYMERTRDESDDVRKMAYQAIMERVPLSSMRTEDAVVLVRRGLADRAGSVRDATTKLVKTWLEEYGGEPMQLVHALGVHEYPEECELVVKTLLERGEINAIHLGRLAESDSIGLRADFSAPGVLMGPASALFWRVVCESLSSEATSKGLSAAGKVGAAARIDASLSGERLEALEAALPPTVADMADIIAKHAGAGAAYRFSTGQLLQLAAKCMDFADAAGRSAASLMLRTLLTDAPSGDNKEEAVAWEAAWHSDAWLRALALFLRKVYGSPAELADAMLDLLGALHRQGGWAAEGFTEAPEQACLHVLGVTGLMLEQLTSARPALAARSEFGLLDLHSSIIQPGLRHRSAKVRREAVRCLGLYCFLDGIPTSPAEHLHVLRQFLITTGESASVRAVAAQALGDIALAHGIKEVDRCLADELARSALPVVNQKPLADLLLEVLREWVDTFSVQAAEAAGRKKSAQRRSRSGEGLESLAALGAAVVEALARLVRTHLRWQTREVAEGRELAMEDVDVVKVLMELVLLYFNPDIEAATMVCQALPVFFQNYAELTAEHQQFLATAFLPAAREAAALDKVVGKRPTAATCTSAKAMGFMAQLLMTPYSPPDGQPGKQEAVGHEMLVDLLLRELLVCSELDAPKPYLAALCRVSAALEVFPVGEAEGGVSARLLLELRRQALAKLEKLGKADSAMRKDLAALSDKLHARARQHRLHVEPFAPDELGQLDEEIKLFQGNETGSLLDDFKVPFDAMPDLPAQGAGGRAGKTPAKTPARGGRRGRAKASSDSDEDEEESEAGPLMPASSDDEDDEEGAQRTPARVPPTASRRMPDRAARSARKPVVDAASSSSSEEEDSEEEDDEVSPLGENMSPAVRRPSKARRQSSDSVSALRQALQENRIS